MSLVNTAFIVFSQPMRAIISLLATSPRGLGTRVAIETLHLTDLALIKKPLVIKSLLGRRARCHAQGDLFTDVTLFVTLKFGSKEKWICSK